MKTIMQDIAKLAGVSPGTVSNALNDRKGVGKETKLKIIEIAESLGYFHNRKKNEEKVIRLILFKKHGYVVSYDTQFFSALIAACENECRQKGYELLISQVIHGEHDKENVLKIINQNKIDGILLLATEMNENDFNLSFREDDKILVEPTLDGAYRDMKEFLINYKGDLPTALFALNDIIALGAIKAMQEQGIKIPEQVSIIGFDDIPFSSLSNPNMTTIRVYTNEMGRLAVKRLLEKIENEDKVSLKIEIDTKLIERNSVIKIRK